MVKIIVIFLLLLSGCKANPKYNQNPDGTTRCRTILDEGHQFVDWATGNEK